MSTCMINGLEEHRPAKRSPQDLGSLLLQFEDVNAALECAIDEAAYKTDGKERDLVTAISYFVESNPALFKAVSVQKSIAIMFDAYRDAFVEVLKDSEGYLKALALVNKSPLQRIASPSQLEKAVEGLVLGRLKVLHSTTPANAIQESLSLRSRISFTGFPDTYACRECDRGAFLDFFNTTIKA